MSIKIPPIVIVDPTEIFNVTETAISNVVTKDFLMKKSGNSNHQIFLQSLDDYNATGNLLVGEVLHVYSAFGENHVTRDMGHTYFAQAIAENCAVSQSLHYIEDEASGPQTEPVSSHL